MANADQSSPRKVLVTGGSGLVGWGIRTAIERERGQAKAAGIPIPHEQDEFIYVDQQSFDLTYGYSSVSFLFSSSSVIFIIMQL